MQIQPYLFFEGRCEEAVEFYKDALGAKVEMLMRFKDGPQQGHPGMPAPDKVMHACISVDGAQIMMSDGMCSGKTSFGGISLSLSARDDAHAKRLFEALAAGGKVQQPLIKTFFSSSFGMVADRFGVPWMIVAGAQGGG